MKQAKRKCLAWVLLFAVVFGNILPDTDSVAFAEAENAAKKVIREYKKSPGALSNPRIVNDSSMQAGQKVTWDCVWFGSYPQAEVVPAGKQYTALNDSQLQDGDLIRDDALYQELESAVGWDAQGDIVIASDRYRRLRKEDAARISSGSGDYRWENARDYHYFKYQPVKWRVLSVNGAELFLLADKALDNQAYHIQEEDVTWETSTVRSWLNGYGANENKQHENYRSNNFIDTAFDISEQSAVNNTYLENKKNLSYGTEGGNDTLDKIFLLSQSQVYTADALGYGFVLSNTMTDEARMAKSSTYAKAFGVYCDASYCSWWLRSPGTSGTGAASIGKNGWALSGINGVSGLSNGVRPALVLSTSSTHYSYAGTICSDGTVNGSEQETSVSYTVSYDANGGTGAPSSQTKYHGEDLVISGVQPVRDGYVFLGWSENSNAVVPNYPVGGLCSKDADLTLYAVWNEAEKPKYTVSYNGNGGRGVPLSQTKTQGTDLVLSSTTPVRDGYEFVGWSESSSAAYASYLPGSTFTGDYNLTLYAVWKKIEKVPVETPKPVYTVSYNSNGGNGIPVSQTKTQGIDLILSSVIPTKSGYEFVGWSESSYATTASYFPGGRYTLDYNITLYAVWKKKPHIAIPTSMPISTPVPTLSPTSPPTKKSQKIIVDSVITKEYGDDIFNLNAYTTGDGYLSYAVWDAGIISMDEGDEVKIIGYGTTKITIKAFETDRYWDAVREITIKVIPRKAVIKKVLSRSKGRMVSAWKKDKTVTGYQVNISGKKASKTFFTSKSLIQGKAKSRETYSVRVRSYKKVGNKKYYGKWSKVKKVKVK